MTTNTTKEFRPDAGPATAIERPTASTMPPESVVPRAAFERDLQSRINERRAELIGVLGELKTDMRLGAAEARDKVKATLSELAHIVKWGIIDGWANLGSPVTHRLEHWLTGSAQQLTAKNDQA